MSRTRKIGSWLLPGLLALPACAAPQPRVGEPEAMPPTSCPFVRIEYSEAEADFDSDILLLTLVYRPPGPTGSSDTLSSKVHVKRERLDDLQADLAARPELVCKPDPDAPGGYLIGPLP